ncbi:SH3 domain-containing protein [Chloroflexota bacterium]
MSDLSQQIAGLRARISALPASIPPEQLIALENEARRLMTAARNTPYEDEARELFGLLAQHTAAAATAPPLTQRVQDDGVLQGLLRRARIIVDLAADDDDVDDAIDILAEALERDPGNPTTHELLQKAASFNPMFTMKVRELFERYDIVVDPAPSPAKVDPPPVPVSDPAPAPAQPAPVVAPLPPTEAARPAAEAPVPASGGDVTALVSKMTQVYYAGDYQETVDFANRVLENQPENSTALEYRSKAEDNMLRGIVPDHRVPFEARVSYNRANSLVRAGNYDEAERLYREARDVAESSGIPSWKDAEQALLEIQDLALARELQHEGDRLMAADDWGEAIRKYEGALRVVPNDPLAQDRLEKARTVQTQYEQTQARLTAMAGPLIERAQTLQDILGSLALLRQQLPGSTRLASLMQEANSRLLAIKSQLNDQASVALTRVESTMGLDERLRLTSEAVNALSVAAQLDPGDQAINTLLQETRQDEAQMQDARTIIERAAALTAQNVDAELSQARNMLIAMAAFSQDPRYRQVVNDLMERYIDRAEAALAQNDVLAAERWLIVLKDEPFRVLGRRTDVLRLETAVRGIKQRRRIRQSLIIMALVLLGVVALLLTRASWEPPLMAIVNPPSSTPTFTPTMTFTPSATPTATMTPSPTLTSSPTITPSWTVTASLTPTHTNTATHTPTPTATFTPSLTFTPSNTPTATLTPTVTLTPSLTLTASNTPPPPVLCRVFVQRDGGVNVRSQPNLNNSRILMVALQGQAMNVLQQTRGDDERVWFLVEIILDGAQVQGWVLRDLLVELTECPPAL